MHDVFGDRLRDLRIRAGLTIEALAGASGVSVRAISDTERGRNRAPRARTVAALAAALRLGPGDAAAFAALARAGWDPGVPAGRPRAGELPRRTAEFVGREAELAVLGDRVTTEAPASVTVLHGPPGVGKTALAIRAAELHRHRFPGGALHVDLRGTAPEPAAPGDVQAVLFRALGVPPRRIAADADERAGQLRALLGRRRCLLVLDDAAGEAQVRELLPGAGSVLITSRRPLGGLAAVRRCAVTPLPLADAVALLRTAGAEPGTEEELVAVARLCGHLPLALRLAANRLAGGGTGRLIAELADADRRLTALSTEDTGVEAAFAVSYERLGGPARTLFRRLAWVPTEPFGAADLAGYDPLTAEDLLEELLDSGLLQPEGADRYRMHELIRLYAAGRLRAEEPWHRSHSA
ncbi:helix-turn-helix domain-containing protein [Catenuloplanes atrovinosus]|uniref:Transcriptional regulator with XRE-family HTH domain n=1 Tax=Catenuloplanes atrovinosus TaxID=137266 RepID=A0AAE4CA57_9ACTN|nr:helix-turn-helix domain-containing protein [Catenuloplanes atrovinosus]MDR7276537.1 transcriptional regulator with XRE-family HTH domain [Catenuloplanes atrovinosus]